MKCVENESFVVVAVAVAFCTKSQVKSEDKFPTIPEIQPRVEPNKTKLRSRRGVSEILRLEHAVACYV